MKLKSPCVVWTLVILLLIASAISGCKTSELFPGCHEVLNKAVTLRLVDQYVDEINGSKATIGRFALASSFDGTIEIQGWMKEKEFLVFEPTTQVQLRSEERWATALGILGSWSSEGTEVLKLAPRRNYVILARLDSGVAAGKHEMRVIIQANNGICIASDPFFSEIKSGS